MPRNDEGVFGAFGVEAEDDFGFRGLDDALNFGPAKEVSFVEKGGKGDGIERDTHAYLWFDPDMKMAPARTKLTTARTIMIRASAPVTTRKLARLKQTSPAMRHASEVAIRQLMKSLGWHNCHGFCTR